MKILVSVFIGIALALGVLINTYGTAAFFAIMLTLWGGGGIFFIIYCWYEKKLDKLQKTRRSPNAWVSHMVKRSRCMEKMMIAYNIFRFLMYLGCVVILEAVILIK